MTHEVSMQSFEQIMDQHEMVVLDFWASWCAPCKVFAPVFSAMAEHHKDVFFGTIDTEKQTDLASAFQIRSVPTLMAFKKGELVFEHSGLLPPAKLEELVDYLRTVEPEPSENPQ
jgi:thioredoxin reductase (NADPH)